MAEDDIVQEQHDNNVHVLTMAYNEFLRAEHAYYKAAAMLAEFEYIYGDPNQRDEWWMKFIDAERGMLDNAARRHKWERTGEFS